MFLKTRLYFFSGINLLLKDTFHRDGAVLWDGNTTCEPVYHPRGHRSVRVQRFFGAMLMALSSCINQAAPPITCRHAQRWRWKWGLVKHGEPLWRYHTTTQPCSSLEPLYSDQILLAWLMVLHWEIDACGVSVVKVKGQMLFNLTSLDTYGPHVWSSSSRLA